MFKFSKRTALGFFVLVLFMTGYFFVYSAKYKREDFFTVEPANISASFGLTETGQGQDSRGIPLKTVLFTGDIMLDRGVEYFMEKNSFLYPFEEISHFLRWIDIVVGNLEGPIVAEPPHFSANSLQFAFSPEVVEGLTFAHFNLLSLANNHTMNAKKAGLEQTRQFLKGAGLDFVGEPVYCQGNSLIIKEGIVFLAFNKTFSFNCLDSEIVEIIRQAREANQDNFLVVLMHWGEEYQSKSSLTQQSLAHQIIESGADLIIGHHSHVVQEIEEYKDRLIFYSLGNFIFDQAFSKEVQEGLTVGLEIYEDELIYRLFPVKTYLQASLMLQEEAVEFLNQLALKSCEKSQPWCGRLKDGMIKIER